MSNGVLIAGCGRIGRRLGQYWAAKGTPVWGLRRSSERLPAPLQTLTGDLTDAGSLPAPPPVDLVYYLATPGRFDDRAYERTYVQGLRNLIEWFPAAQRPRIVFVSSTAVYGQTNGEWVDETTAAEPNGFSGQRMLQAETVAREVGGVAVRFGGIYGPGRTRMLDKVRRGELCISEPPRYTNRVHEDDCVGILGHVGGLNEPAPVYLGVDDAPCTQCELMDYLADLLGAPRPERTSGDPGGVRGSNKRCRNDRLKASGYRLRVPTYREGYSAMLRDG